MIRIASRNDMPKILNIYERARKFMKDNGNETQWNDNFPPEDLLIEDIKKEQLYVYEENNIVHGVFAFIIGEDETYKEISNGKWLSNEVYGTIHRIASDGQVRGVFDKVISYCGERMSHLRIDTHANNKIMRHVILKNGFVECGVIYVEDGTPRVAYEKV